MLSISDSEEEEKKQRKPKKERQKEKADPPVKTEKEKKGPIQYVSDSGERNCSMSKSFVLNMCVSAEDGGKIFPLMWNAVSLFRFR